MKLLHLDASIQNDASVSRILSAAIVDRLRDAHHPVLLYRDLAADPLPHLTLPGFATDVAAAVLNEFLSADTVVIGAPMYNFGIPTQLKAWFDHILISGKTFRYGNAGVEGLAGAKRVIVAFARGGDYSEGQNAAMEHAESHVRAMLGFIGITNVTTIIAEGVAIDPQRRADALERALASIAELDLDAIPA